MKICNKFVFVLCCIVCVIIILLCQTVCRLTAANSKKKTGIVLTFGYHESAFQKNGVVQKLAANFRKETGIRIEFEEYPDAEWRDLLRAELNDGNAPDIFAVDGDPFSLNEKIHPDINCIDLSEEEFVKRMDKEVLPSVSHNGKVYGITFAGKKIWVYSYNKKIFEKLKLKVPVNYQELKEVCQKIKNAGITPMWQAPSSGWHQGLPLFELGPYYESKDHNLYQELNTNKKTIKDIPDLLKVIREINEFSKLGYYGKNYFGNIIDDDTEQFSKGKIAMTLREIGWPNLLAKKHPEMKGDVGIFVMPWADNQIVGINPASNGFFGNAHSKYKTEILKFFRFLARHDNLQKRLNGDSNLLSLCWPEIKSRYPKEYTQYLSKHKTGLVMQAGVSYIDSQWMDVSRDIEKMYAGLITPEGVFNNINIRREKLAKLMKDKYWK